MVILKASCSIQSDLNLNVSFRGSLDILGGLNSFGFTSSSSDSDTNMSNSLSTELSGLGSGVEGTKWFGFLGPKIGVK